MEIDITAFFKAEDPFNYSASIAEMGQDAGPRTWRNAVEAANTWNMLDTEEKREEFRAHIKGFGAWSEAEIAAWTDQELNALFIQLVSGDMREANLDVEEPDWDEYQKLCERGVVPSNIFKGVDGLIYYYIGS